MINWSITLSLSSQAIAVLLLALGLAIDKPRHFRLRRMAFILGIGFLMFGTLLADMEMLLS